MKRAVDYGWPADVFLWLAAVQAEVEALAGLLREATKRKRERTLSRGHLRDELDHAVAALRCILRAGRRGVPVKITTKH